MEFFLREQNKYYDKKREINKKGEFLSQKILIEPYISMIIILLQDFSYEANLTNTPLLNFL